MTARAKQAVPCLRRPALGNHQRPISALLLHGMGGSVSNWDQLALHLPAYLELWDVKLPWSLTGDPAWADERHVTQWVSAPFACLRRTIGKAPDVVIAHSFAANVFLELLAESDLAPAPLTVLIAPFYRIEEGIEWASVIPTMRECYSRLNEEIQARRGSRVSDEIRQAMVWRAAELMGDSPALRFYEKYQHSPLLKLESVTSPVLLVAGSDDVAALVRGARALLDRIPHASLEIIGGCGHFPMIERAPEVAGLVGSFVRRAISNSTSDLIPEAPQ